MSMVWPSLGSRTSEEQNQDDIAADGQRGRVVVVPPPIEGQ